jgi:hypothetical protein
MNGADNNPFQGGLFQDFRMLLIVLILASLALNIMDFLTTAKPVEEQALGNGVIFKDKKGDYYVRYNVTEEGWLGIKYPITITAPTNQNHTDFLKYLLDKNEGNNISCILSWWKHGHPIEGITNLTPFFKAPEPAYLFFADVKKWETSKQGDFSERGKFKEFAQILYNGSTSELKEFAQANNCTTIAVFKNDLYDFLNIHQYLTSRMSQDLTELEEEIKNSLLYKLNAKPASEFTCQKNNLEVEYQDNFSRLFRVCS